jgi:hypothetical protein
MALGCEDGLKYLEEEYGKEVLKPFIKVNMRRDHGGAIRKFGVKK